MHEEVITIIIGSHVAVGKLLFILDNRGTAKTTRLISAAIQCQWTNGVHMDCL